MNKIAMEGNIRKGVGSLVNGTNDREAYPKRWLAALVHTNCEKKVASKLDKLGIENYGGCLHDGFLKNGDFRSKTFLCRAYKQIFHHISERLSQVGIR